MMENIQNLEIETERLILRVPRIEDAPEVNKAMNEVWNELQAWMSWAYDGFNTLEATEKFITDFCVDQIKKGGCQFFGFDKETGRFVVATGITKHEGMQQHECSTGYWVAKDFLGKGYATETTQAMLRYAFNQCGMEVVLIDYYEGNDKSRRVIEKCGFMFLDIQDKSVERCSDGQHLDLHRYKMDKKDFLTP